MSKQPEPRSLPFAIRAAQGKADLDVVLSLAQRRAVRLFCLRSRLVRAGVRWFAWSDEGTIVREWAREYPRMSYGSHHPKQSAYSLPFGFAHIEGLALGHDWREVQSSTVLAQRFEALIPQPFRLDDATPVRSIVGKMILQTEVELRGPAIAEFARRQSEHGTPLGLLDLFAFPSEIKQALAGKGRLLWPDEALRRMRTIAPMDPDAYLPGGEHNIQALAEAVTNDHPPDGLPPIKAANGTRLTAGRVRNVVGPRRAELAE